MQRSLVTNFTIICRKTHDKEAIASLIRPPKMRVKMRFDVINQ